MSGCNGHCQGCGGCGKQLELTAGEITMLRTLGQIPFLPVARRAENDIPVYLEDQAETVETYSRILRNLEHKGLISIDYDMPLKGFSMAAYAAYPIQGSFALTARGQWVLELLELQGEM